MKYADTISHHKGAITGSESSSQFNATQSGSINTVHDTCSQLANRTSATNLFIAYVDGGKSTATDWNFSYVRLDAKQKALANSMKEFNIGENVGTWSTPTLTVNSGTSSSGQYYVIRIIALQAEVATLTNATLVNVGSRYVTAYPTTRINLVKGENTFMILCSGNASIALATGGANTLVASNLVTEWTIATEVQIDY